MPSERPPPGLVHVLICYISYHSLLRQCQDIRSWICESVTFAFRTVPDKILDQWRPAIRFSQQFYGLFSSKWFISLISKQFISIWPFDFTQNYQNYRQLYVFNMGAQLYWHTGMSNFDGMLLCDHSVFIHETVFSCWANFQVFELISIHNNTQFG